MTQIIPGMKALVDQLTAGDAPLRAAIDLDRVNPPGVYVTLERLSDLTMDGGAEATLALYVMVPDQSDEAALTQLEPLLTVLLDKLDELGLPYGAEPIEATRVVSPYPGGADLPAFRVTTSITV